MNKIEILTLIKIFFLLTIVLMTPALAFKLSTNQSKLLYNTLVFDFKKSCRSISSSIDLQFLGCDNYFGKHIKCNAQCILGNGDVSFFSISKERSQILYNMLKEIQNIEICDFALGLSTCQVSEVSCKVKINPFKTFYYCSLL